MIYVITSGSGYEPVLDSVLERESPISRAEYERLSSEYSEMERRVALEFRVHWAALSQGSVLEPAPIDLKTQWESRLVEQYGFKRVRALELNEGDAGGSYGA